MMFSTRGRYALRMIIDLAQRTYREYMPLKEISARQGISQKYLETIAAMLNKGGLLESQRGTVGGYRLALAPSQITVAMVMKLTEGSLAPVACLDCGTPCERASLCLTLPMWQKLDELIDGYLEKITIEDLINERLPELPCR